MNFSKIKIFKKNLIIFSIISSFSAFAETYTTIGGTTFSSDGTSYTTIGDTTFSSDGTTCSNLGDTTFCND